MQNDMRDRLVEIINKDSCPSPYMCSDKCKYSHLEQCIGDRLADRILADGWIRPPCKVGDTVYYLDRVFREVDKCKVYGFTVVNGKLALLVDNGEYKYITTKWCNTKAQAEQKLKELSVE